MAVLDWADVKQRRVVPPFKPVVHDPLDVSNFDSSFTSMPAVDTPTASVPTDV